MLDFLQGKEQLQCMFSIARNKRLSFIHVLSHPKNLPGTRVVNIAIQLNTSIAITRRLLLKT